MRFYHPLIALTFLLAACGGGESGSGYVKNEKGVEVNVKATGEKVRLQVFGDRIIRVTTLSKTRSHWLWWLRNANPNSASSRAATPSR